MAKAIGSPKTGGRKKGTPNKRTLSFGEALDVRGIDLVGDILDAARTLPERERIGVYMGLLPYQFPKRKPSEGPISLTDHLDQLNRDQLNELRDHLTSRLGLDKPYGKMNEDARAQHDQTLAEIERMMRAREELGDGPD